MPVRMRVFLLIKKASEKKAIISPFSVWNFGRTVEKLEGPECTAAPPAKAQLLARAGTPIIGTKPRMVCTGKVNWPKC